jgi:hypothetical protein
MQRVVVVVVVVVVTRLLITSKLEAGVAPVKVGKNNNNNNQGNGGNSSGGKSTSTCSINPDCPPGEYCTRSSNLASGLSCQSGLAQTSTGGNNNPSSPLTNQAPAATQQPQSPS